MRNPRSLSFHNQDMNQHQTPRTSLRALFSSLTNNRQLAMQMVKREVVGRYRGSMMGLAWSFFNPLLMLGIYTFVFTVVFKARWGADADVSKANFAILLFVGLIVHGLFAECVNRAPTLILTNVNYVKKVIFPLEILPWVSLGSALFHAAVSLVVLLLAQLLMLQNIPWTVILFPLVLLPLLFATMGIAWFFASLGVYMRDIAHVTSVFTSALLFLSPVFYPVGALPVKFQKWLHLNPLSYIIEEGRNVVIFGRVPDLSLWSAMLAGGSFVAWAGFAWFQKTRKGFADVL